MSEKLSSSEEDGLPVKVAKTQGGFRSAVNNALKRVLKPKKQSLKNTIIEALDQKSVDYADTPQERVMLKNIVSFSESTAIDVMIARSEVFAIDINTSISKIKKLLLNDNFHTRTLVYEGKIDKIVGFIQIKDLIKLIVKEEKEFSIKPIVKNILFVPPSMKAMNIFLKMQMAKVHLAAVIDEYGAFSGIVTVSDLMSLIVGELEDKEDVDYNSSLEQINKTTYEVSANYDLDKLEKELDIKIPREDDSFDTLGGLVFYELERIPVIGEVCKFEDENQKNKRIIELEVLKADQRKIYKFLLTIR